MTPSGNPYLSALSSIRFIFLNLCLVFLLQGCGGGSSSSDSDMDADPKGFYTGTAAVKEDNDLTDLTISDLQGMVSGDRFMFMSVSEVLIYDGTITDITGESYSATVNIYKDGVLLRTATVDGTITTSSSITGTFTGQGAGNGTFNLTYGLNNSDSALPRIAGDWQGVLNGATVEALDTTISDIGEISRGGIYLVSTPVLAGCNIDTSSATHAIVNVSIYSLAITLINCINTAVNGNYTGFITTQTVADDVLIIAYTNGSFSGSGDMPIN